MVCARGIIAGPDAGEADRVGCRPDISQAGQAAAGFGRRFALVRKLSNDALVCSPSTILTLTFLNLAEIQQGTRSKFAIGTTRDLFEQGCGASEVTFGFQKV